MASKFGALVERLTGAQLFFVEDGANFGSVETPNLASITNKPAGAEWTDFNCGRVNMAKYMPKTKTNAKEYYAPGRGYVEDSEDITVQDAFEFTMIDFAEKLIDQLMFGMATVPVSGTAQQAFKTTRRSKSGWARLVRETEGEALCECEIWVRLSMAQVPEDKNEPADRCSASSTWRWVEASTSSSSTTNPFMRRASDWSVIWAPATAGVLTLLSLDDLMNEEVVPDETGAYNVGTFDGAAGGYPVARGGSSRRLEFSRIDKHESFADAWKAQAQALAADPWGITALIQVQPRGGSARQMRAALLSSRHDMTTETGVIETIHRYRFRTGRNIL